ncbi:MAG TPA: biotin--[acetyl-CoA-carboxylase] ligase, partial [Cellulomonadaceae bacterium]|nr:biotin--[acetyl-CoA-carboxylase] ligase [Cellulomonadaceae bacterium]
MTSHPGPPQNRPALRASVLRELLLAPGGPLARLDVVDRTGSTNADLAAALARDAGSLPDRTLLVAELQDAGRGRAGRHWEAPARSSLAVSFLLRPGSTVPVPTFGWLPLLAGLAAVTAVHVATGADARLKWPNDLLVGSSDAVGLPGWDTDRKVGGILSELVTTPTGPVALLGIGINVSQSRDELPVESAASLLSAGLGEIDREALLVALVRAVVGVDQRWREAHGDAVAAGLADECAAVCGTLGRKVHVDLPGGEAIDGQALALGP